MHRESKKCPSPSGPRPVRRSALYAARVKASLLAMAGFSLVAGASADVSAAKALAGVRPGDVARACNATGPKIPRVDGVDVKAMPAAPDDLPFLLVSIPATGASARIYHDPGLRDVARSRAACFGGLLAQLPPLIPDHRRDVVWANVVLTLDPHYTPQRSESDKRWIATGFRGRWDEDALRFLIAVMPHEEVHQSQSDRRANKLPRWFQEGHAEWIGLKVTDMVRPDLVTKRREGLARERAAAGGLHLGSWGGLKVKPEALERQLSPADRERRARDPSFSPSGPFHFGPGDFAEDNVNQEARYGAALALFDGLEQRHGQAAVAAWVSAVLAEEDNKRIVPLAREMLGEDIEPLLR
jgi:hypothetical protein